MPLSPAQTAAANAVEAPAVVELVQQLIRVPGVSGEERDIVEFLLSRLHRGGWREVKTVGDANVVAVIGDGPTSVLFTVYVDSPPAGAMVDPYAARVIEGERYEKTGPVIRGRGACTKGTLGAMIAGAEAARTAGGLGDRAVALAATTHNERGIDQVMRVTGLAPIGAIAGEPTGNTIGVAARGITWIDVVITGRPTHAGIPDGRVNPIEELAEVLPALRAISLPTREGLPPASLTPIEVSHSGSPPHTPSDVRLRLDRRTLPGETAQSVSAEVQSALDRLAERDSRLQATVSVVDSMRPFEADRRSAVSRVLAEATLALSGREPEYTSMAFGTNGGYLQAHDVPSVCFGPALIADRGDEEHVGIAETVMAARVLACLAVAEALAPRSS